MSSSSKYKLTLLKDGFVEVEYTIAVNPYKRICVGDIIQCHQPPSDVLFTAEILKLSCHKIEARILYELVLEDKDPFFGVMDCLMCRD